MAAVLNKQRGSQFGEKIAAVLYVLTQVLLAIWLKGGFFSFLNEIITRGQRIPACRSVIKVGEEEA